MKEKNVKRLMVAAVTALFAAISMSAMADEVAQAAKPQAVRMTDAQLDQVTAGGATSLNVIFNPGNADVSKLNPANNHATCVNCDLGITPPPGTSGVTAVFTPNGTLITHVVRQSPFPF